MGLCTYTWYLAYEGAYRYDTRHQVFMKNAPCTTCRREPENTPGWGKNHGTSRVRVGNLGDISKEDVAAGTRGGADGYSDASFLLGCLLQLRVCGG